MTEIRHDSFFIQGKGHSVCQDYARSGLWEDGEGYAMVSDGCSGSPDTDLGARFLILSAIRILSDTTGTVFMSGTKYTERLFHNLIRNAARHARHLDPRCLDATLWCAYTRGVLVRVIGHGDGVFACRERATGEWFLHTVEYARSMPYYLSYRLDAQRAAAFRETKNNERSLCSYGYDPGLSLTDVSRVVDDGLTPMVFERERSEVDMVLVGSDGWNTFLGGKDGPADVPLHALAHEVLAFKNTTGQFARRRWQRMERDHRKTGLWHYDDLSLAALYLPDRGEE